MAPVDATVTVFATATSIGTGIVLLISIYYQYKILSKDQQSTQLRRWKEGIFYSLNNPFDLKLELHERRNLKILGSLSATMLTFGCCLLNIWLLYMLWRSHSVYEKCYQEVFDNDHHLSDWFYVQKSMESLWSVVTTVGLMYAMASCLLAHSARARGAVHPSVELVSVASSGNNFAAYPYMQTSSIQQWTYYA